MEFRKLRANEIDVRVGTVPKSGTGLSLLLYKDARVDMNILDETFGIFGWQRHHELIDGQLFCIVGIYDENKNMWVNKQDVGIESNTEEVKGRASDSFKRACTNWGIGRELYTAPFIWISNKQGKVDDLKRLDYRVSDISYDQSGNIEGLTIEMKGAQTSYKWEMAWSNKGYVQSKPDPKKTVDSKNDRAKRDELEKRKTAVLGMFDFAKSKGVDMQSIKDYMVTFIGKTNSADLTMEEITQINQYILDLSNLENGKDAK